MSRADTQSPPDLFVVPAPDAGDDDLDFVRSLAAGPAVGRLRSHERTRFPSGEMIVEVPDDVTSTAVLVLRISETPADALVELLLVADALRRAGVRDVVAVLQYLPYSRSNRLNRPGLPLGSKVVVSLLEQSAIDRFVLFDLHAREVLGYFDKPVTWLTTLDLLSQAIPLGTSEIVVSPDRGRYDDCVHLSSARGADIDLLVKVRRSDDGASELVAGLRTDLRGRSALLYDDEIWSGVTACNAAQALLDAGATRVDYLTVYDFTTPEVRKRLLDDVGVASFTATTLARHARELDGDPRYRRVDPAPMVADRVRW